MVICWVLFQDFVKLLRVCKAVNAIVSNAGGVPVAAEFDLSQERDYKTGKNVLRLNNFVVLK